MFINYQQYYTHKKLCYYFNPSSQIQIIKLKQDQIITYEKVVFSKQRLLFEAFPNCFLEIYSQTFTGTDLVDQILCQCLQVVEPENVNHFPKNPVFEIV